VSTWLVVWFVVGLVTTVALIALGLALGRHALILGRTARRMSEETGPLAREISELGARASEKASGLQPPGGASRRAARG
jgi:hypothetical protein